MRAEVEDLRRTLCGKGGDMPLDECEVTVHIGGAKCGSSAIQAFLRQNVETLGSRGIALPGTGLDFASEVTGEQIWAFEEAATSGDGTQDLERRLSDLFTAADEKAARQVILSAENICNHPALAEAFRRASGNRAIRVVFYVRRQDDFLISSWQQWHLKVFPSLEAYLADRVGRVANWYSMITPWADLFGDANVIVRPFVREQLKDGDVVADFCETLGIEIDGLSPLKRAANPSFDEALARLAHRVQGRVRGASRQPVLRGHGQASGAGCVEKRLCFVAVATGCPSPHSVAL